MEEQYLTVSQLTKYIKRKFEHDPYMDRIFLTGEISNFNRNRRNGHQYFNLKDDQSKISAIMFYGDFKKLKFQPEEGMSVLVIGRISIYEKTGSYQIYIEHMEPDGVGALYQAYEESKKRLTAEGLFDQSLKKPLPKFPEKIGIITSQSGAVIRDIITTVKRRFPSVELFLFPTLVQGDKAAKSIAGNIQRADARQDLDVLIVARGGGSFEDLWPFNEEIVVRAISSAQTPVISSVGHETDTTLSDLVADVRAATPTAAAELAVPVLSDELIKIEQQEHRLYRAYQNRIQFLKDRLARVERSYIFRQPQRLYEGYSQNLDLLQQQLVQTVKDTVTKQDQQLKLLSQRLTALNPSNTIRQYNREVQQLEKQLLRAQKQLLEQSDKQLNFYIQSLEHLSPLKILGRGFAYVRKEDTVVKSTESLSVSDEIAIQLSEGSFKAEITSIDSNTDKDKQ